MKINKHLWEYLKLERNYKCKDVDMFYKKLKRKTKEAKLAWKILRDKYYNDVYKNYLNLNKVFEAGFILDKLNFNEKDYYNVEFLTTPVGKIIDNFKNKAIKNPIVLLTTGGFDPLHEGHIKMMELAKKELEKKGYNIIGGYFSPSHDSYVLTKPYNCRKASERVAASQEYIKDSSWLMIDPWESVYVKTYINFTDVIIRLELYLRKHINNKIKVAYIFGSDNASFMYCFKNFGIGVCVERVGFDKNYEKIKRELNGKKRIFINNNSTEAKYSSREIRKQTYKNIKYEKDNGVYMIRNESIVPLLNFKNNNNKTIIEKAQFYFSKKFINLLNKIFNEELKIENIDMLNQLKQTYKILKEYNTISIDHYYKGTFNIEVSRLFDISDPQKKKLELTNRIGYDTLINQIKKIKAGSYILVDDDSATGSTINGIKELLPENIKIDSIYLLSRIYNENIFDIVDLRDFIIGSINGGLVVRLPNGTTARAPYVLPYVSLKSRANIKPDKEKEISINIWKLNKEFYNKIDKNMKLKQADTGFKNLMYYIGFKDNVLLTDICNWHVKKLK